MAFIGGGRKLYYWEGEGMVAKVPAVVLWWLSLVGGPVVLKALENPANRDMIVAWIVERLPEGIGDGTLVRDIARFLWDHKEEILDFIITIWNLSSLDGQLMGAADGPDPLAMFEEFYENGKPIPFGASE